MSSKSVEILNRLEQLALEGGVSIYITSVGYVEVEVFNRRDLEKDIFDSGTLEECVEKAWNNPRRNK